jgi:hypothetical protein
LLARGPADQTEISEKIQLLADPAAGYEELIDSFIDSPEYSSRFGATLLPTFDAPGGLYAGGMPGFGTSVKLLSRTRGANTDATASSSLSQSVMAAGNPAAPEFVRAGYRVNSYAGFSITAPKSSTTKDYSTVLNLSVSASNWAGLGTPRPTGKATGPWTSGWKTVAKDAWKAGWAPAKYV